MEKSIQYIVYKVKKYLVFYKVDDKDIINLIKQIKCDDKEKTIKLILNHYYKIMVGQIYNGDFSCINNYLLYNLSYDIKCINHLSNLLTKLEFISNFEMYEKIINQNVLLQDILNKILKRWDYSKNQIQKLSNSPYTVELLETYAVMNDIEMKMQCEEIDDYIIENQFINEIITIPLLTLEEERKLTREYYETRDINIRNKIFEANLRFVLNIAKKFHSDYLTFYDLVQEGSIGLMTAIERFDPNKGYKLSTYAYWWIEREINNAIKDNSSIIRIPRKKITAVSKYKKLKAQLNVSELNLKTITSRMNISLENIKEYEFIDDKINSNTSVNFYINDDEVETGDLIPDKSISVEEEAIRNVELSMIKKALFELSDKEREVIILRYGLNNSEPMTLQAIGNLFGNSREGISKVEDRALQKIKKIIKKYN